MQNFCACWMKSTKKDRQRIFESKLRLRSFFHNECITKEFCLIQGTDSDRSVPVSPRRTNTLPSYVPEGNNTNSVLRVRFKTEHNHLAAMWKISHVLLYSVNRALPYRLHYVTMNRWKAILHFKQWLWATSQMLRVLGSITFFGTLGQ